MNVNSDVCAVESNAINRVNLLQRVLNTSVSNKFDAVIY